MKKNRQYDSLDRQRRAGVLLHPTSLPGPGINGDIGHQAYRFIEFLKSSGFKVWQMLPLGPTHDDNSPYQCLSAHAGNPLLISLEWLEDKQWLDRTKIKLAETDKQYRLQCLKLAAANFYSADDTESMQQLSAFKAEHKDWLDDFALFMALKIKFSNQPWYQWPVAERHRDTAALNEARTALKALIQEFEFQQFIFFRQWHEIRDYGKQHDVELFGDMPIFVARDSADVWACRQNFLMDADGNMSLVAGVPPDAFSDSGQRWGNPLFDWEYMQSDGFSWWKHRFKTQLELFDLVRLDHFRGLESCWQIPASEDTAINGRWVKSPGRELLTELFAHFHRLPLIAEDLGVITDEVIALKKSFQLAGMKVLQFAFDGNTSNPHLPHRHDPGDVVYTGTHDNDTSLGWIRNATNYHRDYFKQYLDIAEQSEQDDLWALIRHALLSVSFLSVLPMQDLLMLDSSQRMNTPGTVGDNWSWRFNWDQLKPETVERISKLIVCYQR
ncbi:MAG: 4-alpha-glucanotransferase [Gammaproteobacteria bacterium]|nr:4-alpha-glucanotransferase [Gammaproteobacteria bacterium]